MRKISGSSSGLQKANTTGTSKTSEVKTNEAPVQSSVSRKTEESQQEPAKQLTEESKSQRKGDKQLSGLMKQSVFQGALDEQKRLRADTKFENEPVAPGRGRSETKFEAAEQLDLNRLPLRPRAMGRGEKTLPEAALDLKHPVAQSETNTRLQNQIEKPNADLSNYFKESNQKIASPGEAREKQFQTLEQSLNKAASDKTAGPLAEKEKQLLQETRNDRVLMNSPHVKSPNHAMELKRLGMQPSVAGRVGEFTDTRLDKEGMKKLGSGNLNTVYIGKYHLPDKKESYDGVFKPEVKNWDPTPIGGEAVGIDRNNPRAGYRNVATTRLDEALGFNNLTTRSEMAIHKGELGTVSEKAPGLPPQGSKMLSNQRVPDETVANGKEEYGLKGNPNFRSQYASKDWVEGWNKDPDNADRQIGERKVGGKNEYFFMRTAARDINYNDPKLRQDLVRLQLMDSISGQADRHPGNYFVNQSKNGQCHGLKGIDNDLSWGKDLKTVENIGNPNIHLPAKLPPVVDQKAYNSIMAMNHETLQAKMGGMLTTEEINAANDRLNLVKAHISNPQKCSVLPEIDERKPGSLEAWSSSKTTASLMTTVNGEHSSYISRDYEWQQNQKKLGVLIPFEHKK